MYQECILPLPHSRLRSKWQHLHRKLTWRACTRCFVLLTLFLVAAEALVEINPLEQTSHMTMSSASKWAHPVSYWRKSAVARVWQGEQPLVQSLLLHIQKTVPAVSSSWYHNGCTTTSGHRLCDLIISLYPLSIDLSNEIFRGSCPLQSGRIWDSKIKSSQTNVQRRATGPNSHHIRRANID